jgi:phosphate-selective porin OprO and OprP
VNVIFLSHGFGNMPRQMTTTEKDYDQMGTRGNSRGWNTLRTSLAVGALACTVFGARPAAAQTPDQMPATPPADPGAAPAAPPADATPAPAPAPAPVPMAPALAPMAADATPAVDNEPLAGFSNGTAFLRSPDNGFILFPNGRLQSDFYAYKTAAPFALVPKNSFILKRARLELAGWVGSFVYFQIGADFASGAPTAAGTAPAQAAQTNVNATDDFVAIAPCQDYFILQVGQFDAPFTLENRTSDKYFDFMERSLTVRAFGIPTNKEQGAMVHGTNPERNYYYSLGVFNGDGQNFKNLDNNFDVMGRGWIAPASFMGEGPLHDITVGGSFWTGNHDTLSQPLSNQTTAGGFVFLPTALPTIGTEASALSLNQVGRQKSYALEVNAPIMHKFGVRWEFVHKDQPLSALDTSMKNSIDAGLHLKGYSTYFEAWGWVLGDDRIVGEPGMQMPTRLKKFGVKPPQQGVQIVTRLELLDEKLTADSPAGGIGSLKTGSVLGLNETKVTSWQLGVTYWMSKRFRAMANYTINHFGGDASYVSGDGLSGANLTKTLDGAKNEQEFSLRLAIAL